MLLIDLVNNGGGVVTLLAPQTLTAAAQGASFDASNLDVSTNAILSLGAIAAGITNGVVQVEESPTGTGSWTVIPGMVFAAVTQSTGNVNTTQVVRGQRTYRYVRANAVTQAGTTVSVPASVVLVSQARFSAAGTAYGSGSDRYPGS